MHRWCRTGTVLLILLLSTPVQGTQAGSDSFLTFDQQDGITATNTLALSGQSTVGLSNITWTLIDLDSNEAVMDSGQHMDSVVPEGEGRWSWSLEVNTTGVNCTCIMNVQGQDWSAKIHVYIGAPSSWRPVWHSAPPSGVVLVDGSNASVLLDMVLPPERGQGLTAVVVRCQAMATGICLGDTEQLRLPLSFEQGEVRLVMHWATWSQHSRWSVESLQVEDALLAQSASQSMMVLLDDDDPVVTLDHPAVVYEDEQVRVYITAEDADSGAASIIRSEVIRPDGTFLPLTEVQRSDGLLSFVPDRAGIWMVDVEVADVVGHMTDASASIEVLNLPPELVVRLDGSIVESSGHYVIPEGVGFELNASDSTDTPSDAAGLNVVWWIGTETRLAGEFVLTEQDFLPGVTQSVRVQVVDDDGESVELAFSIHLEGQPDSFEEGGFFGPAAFIVAGTTLILLYYARKRLMVEQIPTWPSDAEENEERATVDRTEA